MKRYLLLILIIMYVTACREDESIQPGQVQFSFSPVSSNDADGKKPVSDIPAGASLRITVAKDGGETVFTSKKIGLIKTGSNFLTTPVVLPQGKYIIQDFMIVTSDDSLLFAVPKQGSDLAQLIKNPLPIPFNVGTKGVSNIVGEVISAARKTPELFGYTSFGVKVSPAPSLSMTAFTADRGNVTPTTARCVILHGTDTVFKKSLSASINELIWNADPKGSYTLVVMKDGYAKYQQQFSPASLSIDPLAIVLEPALTVNWSLQGSTIYLDGKAGAKLSIDWGDDLTENVLLQNTGFTHNYSKSGTYFVSITGELSAINFFEIEYQDGINTVTLIHLDSLEDFRLPLCQYTSNKIDFSLNTKLQNIDLSGIRGGLHDIDISNNTKLQNLDLQGDNIPSDIMDKMIDVLYESCRQNNRKNGFLNISTVVFDNPYTPSSRDLMGPPSSPRVQKLNKLVKDFGWFVFPICTLTPDSNHATTARLDNNRHLRGKELLLQRYLSRKK